MEQLFGAAYAAALPARMTLFFFSLYKYLCLFLFFFCFLHVGVLLCCSTLEKISNTIF